MADSENGPQHTPEDHAAYLRRVRTKVKELADLVDAAPCPYTLGRAVLMVRIMANHFEFELAAEMAMQEFEGNQRRTEADREEKTKRLFGFS